MTIRETVETIARLVGFDGELRWDPTKPDGQPRRRVDATRAEHVLGWRARMPFEDGLRARSTGTSPTAEKPNAPQPDPIRVFGAIGVSDVRRPRRRNTRMDSGQEAGGDGGAR